MLRRDMAEVLRIEAESFQFAWNEADFVRCLRNRDCSGRVAEEGGEVVGFVVYTLGKTKIELLNLAVAKSDRRRGVGAWIIAEMAAKLRPQRRSQLVVKVRETNLAAQLFFRANGFRAVGILRRHYAETAEDALVMRRRVSRAVTG